MKSLPYPLAAIVLGIAFTLSFAPYEIFPLAILAPAGLLLLLRQMTVQQAFWRGYCFGLGAFGSGVYWIFISIHEYGLVPTTIALLITLLFITSLAVFPAMVGYWLLQYFPKHSSTQVLCAFPVLWVFCEWLRSWIFTGFPWLFAGYSQTQTPLKGYAPVLGIYGVSLITIFSSALLVRSYLFLKERQHYQAYQQLLILFSIWILGSLLTLVPWTRNQGQPLKISLIQGNIAQEIKWSPKYLQTSYDRYLELTKPLLGKSQLIIWPESAIPTTLQDAATYINHLHDLAIQNNTDILLGIPIEAAPPANGYYNSIVSIRDAKQVYIKRKLVPFGEFIPFKQQLANLLSVFHIPMADMLPGQFNQPPFMINKIQILPAICYEVAFPYLMYTQDQNLGLLLTISNDAWFDRSAAQAQHLQMAAMRALELKRPLLFVSNNGITALIDADGNMQSALLPYKTGVLTTTVQPRYGLTPWMQNGMTPVVIIMLYMLFLAIREQNKERFRNSWFYKRIILTDKSE